MNTLPIHTRYHLRSRSPRLTLAFWTFAFVIWLDSLLTGTIAKAAVTNPPADFYCLIVDRSGSMGPGENNLVGPATEKLREFVANLEPNITLQIVFFDSRVGKFGRWTGLTPETKESIHRWITAEFHPSGGTRLFDTVGQVLTDVLKEREQFGRIGLLVFSDGEDNESKVFKGWPEIERLSGNLVAQHPTAFMRLYSLGSKPGSKPGAPWKTEAVPNAADLRQIIMEPAPEARFKILPEDPETGQTVTFVVLPGPSRIESVSWNFGDGSTSKEAAVEHPYTTDGVFNGSLTVTGPAGRDTKPITVTVSKRASLTAAFSWFPKSAPIGSDFEFIDESSGGPSARHWHINGQLVGEGSRYSWRTGQSGDHVVRLKITRGKETREVEHTITVLPPNLDASFVVSPSHSVTIGTEITARPAGVSEGASHKWHVAGVNIGNSRDLKWVPAVTGLMEITHTVTRGGEVATTVDRVQVVSQPPPAEFTVTPGLEADLGQSVTISAKTTNPAWRHTLKLSTGETFNVSSATLPVKKVGRVEILHIVESQGGRSEARETLIVRDAVTAEFSAQSDGNRTPAEFTFTPKIRAGIISWEWAFGDGAASSDQTPVHTYTSAGKYQPTLKVRDVAGRQHTFQLAVPIVIMAPRAWWLPWAIAVGAVLALAIAVAGIVHDRQRPLDLEGRLEWQFGGDRGRTELAGRQLDLGSLNIPGWKPTGAYSLVRRKSAGHQLLRDGVIEQAVEEDSSLEAEGVRLRLVP